MHNAPPVAFPVGRFVWGDVAHFSLAVCGAVGLILWQVLGGGRAGLGSGAWLFWGGCVLAAVWWAPRQILSDGHLLWSGERWLWQSADGQQQSVEVSVCLDLEVGLWLAVQRLDVLNQSKNQPAFAWVRASAMPSKWHGFRCAVYSRPIADVNLVR